MARHPDPVVRDLLLIRRLHWSRPESFSQVEVLLDQPVVLQRSEKSGELPEKVAALKSVLHDVVARIEKSEGTEAPFGRSLALACTALLRLSPEFSEMSLKDIRAHIAGKWSEGGGGSISAEGFRLHLEVPTVYVPFAAEFRRFARKQVGDEGGTSPARPKRNLSPVADALVEMEKELHEERLAHIREEGLLRVSSEEEMFAILMILTRMAKKNFLAVDYVEVDEWFSSPKLNEYLRHQLARVAKEKQLSLERIRIVRDDELQPVSRRREQLDVLIRHHEEAGAELLLCREEAIEQLQLGFAPHVGLLMIDVGATPTALTGKLTGDGRIGRALAYVSETDEVRTYQEEYKALRMAAQVHDRELRDMLETH